jgi:hypothetical protein
MRAGSAEMANATQPVELEGFEVIAQAKRVGGIRIRHGSSSASPASHSRASGLILVDAGGRKVLSSGNGRFFALQADGRLAATVESQAEAFDVHRVAGGFSFRASNGCFLAAGGDGSAVLTWKKIGVPETLTLEAEEKLVAIAESTTRAASSWRLTMRARWLGTSRLEGWRWPGVRRLGTVEWHCDFQDGEWRWLAAGTNGRITSAESDAAAKAFKVARFGDGFSVQAPRSGRYLHGGSTKMSGKAKAMTILGFEEMVSPSPEVLRIRRGSTVLGGDGFGGQVPGLTPVLVGGRAVFRTGNGKFLALRPAGSLEAPAGTAESAESFTVQRVSGGFSFRGSNGCFISAEGGKAMLEAKVAGEAETLTLEGPEAVLESIGAGLASLKGFSTGGSG